MQLTTTTRELIFDKIDTLKQQRQTLNDILPKIAEQEQRFEQSQMIEIALIDMQIDTLKRMIFEDTDMQ